MRYKFYINTYPIEGQDIELGNLHTDSHSRVRSRENDQAFLRAKISNGLILSSGSGYHIVNDGSYEDEWIIKIYEVHEDSSETEYFFGTFTKSDCNIDKDTQRIIAELTPLDKYSKLLKQFQREYKLIDLGLTPVAVEFKERSLIQVWVLGSNEIFHLNTAAGWNGVYGERIAVISLPIYEEYRFSNIVKLAYAPGQSTPDFPYNVFGDYTYQASTPAFPNGRYVHSSGAEIFKAPVPGPPVYWLRIGGNIICSGESLRDLRDNEGVLRVQLQTIDYAARILTNADSFNGIDAFNITEGDVYASGSGFSKVIPYDLVGFSMSDVHQSIDAGYGRVRSNAVYYSGQYFTKPDGVDYPAFRKKWGVVSLWFTWDESQKQQIEDISETRRVNDAYTITDVIDRLVDTITEGDIGHSATLSGGGQLLYDNSDPITGENSVTLLVVPKSNILVKNYSSPATASTIRFSQVVEMLKAMRAAKWFIANNNNVIFEHNRFFEQGGTYSDEGVVSVDISTEKEVHTQLPWDFYSNKFSYKKSSIPQRIVLKAMDQERPEFGKSPLVIQSSYAEADVEKEYPTSVFSYDLDYAITNPGAFSDTGFFLLATRRNSNGVLAVVEGEMSNGAVAQNHLLSRNYVLRNYYLDAAPARTMSIDGEIILARSLARNMDQKIKIGYIPDADYNKLISAKSGKGKVDTVSEKMTTGETSITLLYEPQ